jgi:uncharacterized protein YcbK (DUF882 family)
MLRTFATLLFALAVMLGGGIEAYGQAKSSTPSGSAKKLKKASPKKAQTRPATASRGGVASRGRKQLKGPANPTGKMQAGARRTGGMSKPQRTVGTSAPRRHAASAHTRIYGKPGSVQRQAGKRIVAARRTTAGYGRPAARPSGRAASARYAMRVRPGASSDKARSKRYGRASRYRHPFSILPPAPPAIDEDAPRTLSLYHVHTQQEITVTFWRDGKFVQSELDRLNDFLRDSRNGTQVQMDPELFNVLWLVPYRLRSSAPYRVLSAYRSPETNSWLASVSRGVASDSLHMRGQAIDVTLPGHSAGQVRAAARVLGLGGVGYYPRSGFVHLDTGPIRYW